MLLTPQIAVAVTGVIGITADLITVTQGFSALIKLMRRVSGGKNEENTPEKEELEKAWTLIEEQLKELQNKIADLQKSNEAFDSDVFAPHFIELHPFETMEAYVQNEVTEALNSYIYEKGLNIDLFVTARCIYLLLQSNDYRVNNRGNKGEVHNDIVKPIVEKLDKEFGVWMRAVSYF